MKTHNLVRANVKAKILQYATKISRTIGTNSIIKIIKCGEQSDEEGGSDIILWLADYLVKSS